MLRDTQPPLLPNLLELQIKGFPVRLPVDVLLVFSVNPKDDTARGRIVTPLKDRIGPEIRIHYPLRLEDNVRIVEQECWIERSSPGPLEAPGFIQEIVEAVAFFGRRSQRGLPGRGTAYFASTLNLGDDLLMDFTTQKAKTVH